MAAGPLGAAVAGAAAALGSLTDAFQKAAAQSRAWADQAWSARETARRDVLKIGAPGEPGSEQERDRQARELRRLEGLREDAAREMLSYGTRTDETTRENRARTENWARWLDKEIDAIRRSVDSYDRRNAAVEASVRSYRALSESNVKAYRAAQREFEERRRRQREEISEANTSNVKAYRAAQRQYDEQMYQIGIQSERQRLEFSRQQTLNQIRTGTFQGEGSPGAWLRRARERRLESLSLQDQIEASGDPEKIRRLQDRLGVSQAQFGAFMQIAEALRDASRGNPVRRVDLQGLTGVASRGGWMGERYGQPQYMETLNRMYEALKSIDDNTREAERDVWR